MIGIHPQALFGLVENYFKRLPTTLYGRRQQENAEVLVALAAEPSADLYSGLERLFTVSFGEHRAATPNSCVFGFEEGKKTYVLHFYGDDGKEVPHRVIANEDEREAVKIMLKHVLPEADPATLAML